MRFLTEKEIEGITERAMRVIRGHMGNGKSPEEAVAMACKQLEDLSPQVFMLMGATLLVADKGAL